MLVLAALLTAMIALATALPFLPVAHGVARVGDFPRQQMLAAALVLLAVSFFFSNGETAWLTIQLTLAATAAVQIALIAEFTPLVARQSKTFDPAVDTGEPLRLVAANVKMSNSRYGDLTAELRSKNPDLVVLMEVNAAWADGMAGLLADFPHVADQRQENSYGMILASRLELRDTSIQCLLTKGVPSIFTTVVTPKGQRFRLYSIHPEPPVPHLATEGRDGETSLVALKTREETLPVMVTGDLNDVAWSKTTRRFRRISGLLDPRVGRKIFSTFDARYPLIRWPLDHLFHSAEFRFVGMERLKACGSDHFPVMFDLVLCPDEKAETKPEEADGEDIGRAKDLVKAADERDEKAIGSDWET